jgi:hypothetical protein
VPGHTVKIYQPGRDEESPDYRSYVCSETGCGRADKDSPRPGSSSVAVTQQRPNGDVVTKTKHYP